VAFHKALGAIIELVTKGNEYVQSTQPWALAKDPGKRVRLGTVLYNALEASRVAALLMAPFTPTAAQKLWEALVPGGGLLETRGSTGTARGEGSRRAPPSRRRASSSPKSKF